MWAVLVLPPMLGVVGSINKNNLTTMRKTLKEKFAKWVRPKYNVTNMVVVPAKMRPGLNSDEADGDSTLVSCS